MVTDIQVRNDKKVADELRQVAEDLRGKPFMRDMYKATMIVLRDAKKNAPVDTGRLRNGLNNSVEKSSFIGLGVKGIVGVSANVEYGAYMEEGTGIFAGNPRVKMPPPKALEGWARRHGANAYVIARAIYKQGGLKPRHFLKNALEDNEQRIVGILGNSVKVIIRNHGFG